MNKNMKAFQNIKREVGIPYFSTLYDIDMFREDMKTIEKSIKALEVINKRVDLLGFVLTNRITFTEEEYNLLIEVLKKF